MKNYLYEGANRYIIDTKHSIERFNDAQRFNQNAGTEDFERAIIKVIRAGIDTILSRLGDRKGKYVIHSQGSNINVVIAWDYPPRDFPFRNYKNRHQANVVTILPIKKDPYMSAGDQLITVAENIQVIRKADSALPNIVMIIVD